VPYPFPPRGSLCLGRLDGMPKARRAVLLRIANVNPDSVSTHSDRVLYSAIGVFIVLYAARLCRLRASLFKVNISP
jgi:hypothetical protein